MNTTVEESKVIENSKMNTGTATAKLSVKVKKTASTKKSVNAKASGMDVVSSKRNTGRATARLNVSSKKTGNTKKSVNAKPHNMGTTLPLLCMFPRLQGSLS